MPKCTQKCQQIFFSGSGWPTINEYTGAIWKLCSMVLYLSYRSTRLFMFSIILNSYYFYMLGHKFQEDVAMQTRTIVL